MTKPLDEQIIDVVKTKLAAITVAGGYQTDMAAGRVHWPPVGDLEFDESDSSQLPAIIIRRASKATRWHLRGAEEMVLRLSLTAVATTYDAALVLMSDILKAVNANERWNNGSADLAVRTWLDENDAPAFDEQNNLHYGHLLISIKTYADLTNPTAVKAI